MSGVPIIIPKAVIATFCKEAALNKNGRGQLNETMCYLTGHSRNSVLTVTDLVFPRQTGDGGKVSDDGELPNT